LSYNDDLKSNYVALENIEQFLDSTEDDSISWYIKGKILTNLKKYEEALSAYNTSIESEFTSRTLYRIGRLKEQHLKEDGINDLYSAYIDNQSSACCCRVLQQYSFIKGIKIEADDTNSDNLLIQGFNSRTDPWDFQRDFEELLKSPTEVDLYQQTAFDMILGDFVSKLKQSKESFHVSGYFEEDYDYDDDYYNELDYEPDYDEMYFDAMTDGQLGSYDEFLENGGNLDYIDDWAGR
jgi:tetratricopeptide (TPR) repeat protein